MTLKRISGMFCPMTRKGFLSLNNMGTSIEIINLAHLHCSSYNRKEILLTLKTLRKTVMKALAYFFNCQESEWVYLENPENPHDSNEMKNLACSSNHPGLP